MPYVITRSEPFNAAEHVHRPAFTRRAVATLEEARDAALAVVREHPAAAGDWPPNAAHVIDAGALVDADLPRTVGPLPDGTVIEVEPVSWDALNAAAGYPVHAERLLSPGAVPINEDDKRQIIDVYNAREAARA